MPEFPTSISNINKRLQTLGAFDADRKARIIANIIAAQMLPDSALRGGTLQQEQAVIWMLLWLAIEKFS
jgi:hypothetical protein